MLGKLGPVFVPLSGTGHVDKADESGEKGGGQLYLAQGPPPNIYSKWNVANMMYQGWKFLSAGLHIDEMPESYLCPLIFLRIEDMAVKAPESTHQPAPLTHPAKLYQGEWQVLTAQTQAL